MPDVAGRDKNLGKRKVGEQMLKVKKVENKAYTLLSHQLAYEASTDILALERQLGSIVLYRFKT